ncbi:asparagine synthase (glutamine-hydrolyzing) [Candidatus Parcubacteria bacterium]|nr:MAG: asparagine synthase (glutamine-hydrolyzing) [Candidatus Parcubacteria bacterium]
MCGIAGKLFFGSQKVESSEIQKMLKTLVHRGPDDEGIFLDNNLGLGHKRLAIIDLSSQGRQPISDAEGKFWLTYDGEIYNYQELRRQLEKEGTKFKSKTDSEVIIYLYRQYGPEMLTMLRGMFAFAIWDKQKQELFLARDRLGQKPLKYFYNQNCFIFASELKTILTQKEVKKEIDWSAIDEFLIYSYVPTPKTGFQNIKKLPPAHYLIIKADGNIQLQRWWRLDFSQKLKLKENEWEQIITEKLIESIKIRLQSDVPLGAHLSGRIDSSLIVALMAGESSSPIKTYSVGFGERDYNELPFARKVAKRYRTDHQEIIVNSDALELLPKLAYYYEEPFGDSSAVPNWHLMQATRQHIAVALNGDGGDENFAGYDRYRVMQWHRWLKLLPAQSLLKKSAQKIYYYLHWHKAKKIIQLLDILAPTRLDTFLRLINAINQTEKQQLLPTDKPTSDRPNFLAQKFQAVAHFSPLDQLLWVGINSHLPDNLLVKIDIASMAHSLEVRSPFLDHEFMELTAKLPPHLKLRGNIKKYLLKKIAARFIPEECIYRRKQGFSLPLEHWFRKKNYLDLLRTKLLHDRLPLYGFNTQFIGRLIEEHRSFRADHSRLLWNLLYLNEWFKVWF